MEPNLEKLQLRFLSSDHIYNEVNRFRREHIGSVVEYPVNIELVAEDIGLEIVPIVGLEDKYGSPALLLADMKTIYAESGHYNSTFQTRLRFSVAHEIGHWWLHKHIFTDCLFDSPRQWADYITSMPEDTYSRFEYQANEFAGQLLVPRSLLRENILDIKEKIETYIHQSENRVDKDLLLEFIAPRFNRKYDVSNEVIIKRIRRDKLLEDIFHLE